MARGEIHVQLSVTFGADPKVRALARYGRDARGCRDLYVQILCYCKSVLTDGFVPDEELPVLVYPDPPKTGKRDADRLAQVGLLDRVDGGYQVPSWLKRNKSRAQVDAESAIRAESGRKGGYRSGESRRDTKQSASPERSKALPDDEAQSEICLNTEVIGQRTEVRGQRTEDNPGTAAAAAHLPAHAAEEQQLKRLRAELARAHQATSWANLDPTYRAELLHHIATHGVATLVQTVTARRDPPPRHAAAWRDTWNNLPTSTSRTGPDEAFAQLQATHEPKETP